MAWRRSGYKSPSSLIRARQTNDDRQSNTELVQKLYAAGIITSMAVKQAMQATDRRHYTCAESAYEDAPQLIMRPAGVRAQATISAPHVHALALEVMVPYLRQEGDCRVLDVGCGSGYLLACLFRLVRPGRVVGIDHASYLTDLTRRNLCADLGNSICWDDEDDSVQRMDSFSTQERRKDGIRVVTGDGRQGVEKYAPHDAIHVGAAAVTVHEALVKQLKSPGVMFIPVGEAGKDQYVHVVRKDEHGRVTQEKTHGVRYVPLTDAE